VALVLAGSFSAQAELCAIDDVPAATLLLPYFETQIGRPSGVTTLFEINNASASATLAHVVVWSDLSVPVLDFDVYLTGFDVVTINMRDILDGNLPVTASVGQDPADTISPKGPLSQDINFASCNGFLPFPVPALDAAQLAHLRASLTGQPSALLSGRCAGLDFGDDIARGYVTVDVSNECSLEFPSSLGYFAPGGGGIAGNRNILWGNYYYVDPSQNFAQSETLVHIEADASITELFGGRTFYGRYTAAGEDNREPLPNQFAARYVANPVFDGGTDLIVWREALEVDIDGFSCAAGAPAWFPLSQDGVIAFDEQEDAAEICIPGEDRVSPPTGAAQTCFPAEAQRIPVAASNPIGDDVATPFDSGWLLMDLGYVSLAAPGVEPQAWVTSIISAEGRFSVGMDAVHLNNLCVLAPTPG
jgi:hypothetical protein